MPRALLSSVTSTGNGIRGPLVGIEGTESSVKTVQGVLTGTGAVSASVSIDGSMNGVNWTNLGTLTLSGTTTAIDTLPPGQNTYSFFSATPSAITGTGATLIVYLGD